MCSECRERPRQRHCKPCAIVGTRRGERDVRLVRAWGSGCDEAVVPCGGQAGPGAVPDGRRHAQYPSEDAPTVPAAQFLLALAEHDVGKMEAVLQSLVTPRSVAGRNNDESGFTEDLISKAAVIYAKIAWRDGYRLQPNSPLVPEEWLPATPLAKYSNHYGFLN
ncbi:Imm49 family immunity protein [Caenimonas terrae]|uniref:Imm49 family immunity protein n=1 Tax=Caenimonas terrae TaxID=696074 RepID=A0ABW0NJ74_9BURK